MDLHKTKQTHGQCTETERVHGSTDIERSKDLLSIFMCIFQHHK